MEKKKSLLAQLLDGAAELVKRPFVERAISRGFESAKDSIESKQDDLERALIAGREQLVKVAQGGGSLEHSIQKLVDLQQEKAALKVAADALATEKTEFLD
jgi:ribosome modulation factor